MTDYVLQKSSRVDKKFMVKTPQGKIIHFGANNYSDFTLHKDEKRKENYIKRHGAPASREDWSDLNKASCWARYILWNKPTLTGSIRDMEKRFGIKIVKKI